jgi:hypothetical protein
MALYDQYRQKYTSDAWTFLKSSRHRFPEILRGYHLAFSRFKARKLVCAHVLLDPHGKIADLMFSGDYFIKPIDGDDRISEALLGLDAADPEAIQGKIRRAAQDIGFEAVMMGVEDFATPVIEACRKALAAR